VNEIDEFKYPRRRPWLLLAALLVIAAVLIVRYKVERRPAPKAAVSAPAEAPRPALAVAAKTALASTNPAAAALAPQAPAPSSTSNVTQRLASARAMEEQGNLLEARMQYQALLKLSLSPQDSTEIETRLGKVNIELIATPLPMPEKVDYIVNKGDSVERIARKFGTTVDLVKKSNQIAKPDLIRAGDRIRVLNGKFSVKVIKSRYELVLFLNDQFFKRYAVGTGKYGKTPPGTFVVNDKVAEPVWWHPDGRELPYGHPENILGTRWLALKATGNTIPVKGYGIHGTTNDSSIGKAESSGCVRMKNGDVEELFEILPLDTPVTIED
jgi:lipoprotein-anchoring transpeptidase ErfK/SrfK